MNDFEKSQKFWAEEIVRGNLKYPDTHVIRFAKKNLKPGESVLDFGCGAGRNAIALAEEGFDVIAMDYNATGLALLQEKAGHLQNKIQTVVNTGLQVPLEEQSVDAIVADGSLFYNNRKDTVQLLQNLGKVLKPGGCLWGDWRAKEDSMYGMGEEIEDGFFRMYAQSGREGSMYHFYDKDTLLEVYSQTGNLKIVSCDEYRYTLDNGKAACAYYHVVAQRI